MFKEVEAKKKKKKTTHKKETTEYILADLILFSEVFYNVLT